MKYVVAAGFTLFLGPLALIAQSTGQAGMVQLGTPQGGVAQMEGILLQSAPSHQSVPNKSACPIGIVVRQGSGQGMLKVRDGQRAPNRNASPSQRLRMTLTNPRSGQIAGATVTVHGSNAKSHIADAGSSGDKAFEITKTLQVRFAGQLAVEARQEVSADLVLAGFTSTSLVELNSVTYADGSMWKFSGRETCQVAPDSVMLLAGR